jgi:hypothetical protein
MLLKMELCQQDLFCESMKVRLLPLRRHGPALALNGQSAK